MFPDLCYDTAESQADYYVLVKSCKTFHWVVIVTHLNMSIYCNLLAN